MQCPLYAHTFYQNNYNLDFHPARHLFAQASNDNHCRQRNVMYLLNLRTDNDTKLSILWWGSKVNTMPGVL